MFRQSHNGPAIGFDCPFDSLDCVGMVDANMTTDTAMQTASIIASRNIRAEMQRRDPIMRADELAQKLGMARATLYTRYRGTSWTIEELIKAAEILEVDLMTLLRGVEGAA
jgi:Bacteriophage CI repressor helix-turn-helix domain